MTKRKKQDHTKVPSKSVVFIYNSQQKNGRKERDPLTNNISETCTLYKVFLQYECATDLLKVIFFYVPFFHAELQSTFQISLINKSLHTEHMQNTFIVKSHVNGNISSVWNWGQVKSLSPVWTLLWTSRFALFLEVFPQWYDMKEFSPVWVNIWFLSVSCLWKSFHSDEVVWFS